jgi:16S rRNA processing protein RimM
VADDPTHLAVGQVSRPHGTKGEVCVVPLTDHPEDVFVQGVVLRLLADEGDGPDESAAPLTIETVRPFREGYLVRFAGFGDRDQTERLRARTLVMPVEELQDLDEGEYFIHQLVGLSVRTTSGRELGVIEEVYPLEPAHLLEVQGAGRTFLIPMTEQIVREVDVEAGTMVVDPPDGLLDL